MARRKRNWIWLGVLAALFGGVVAGIAHLGNGESVETLWTSATVADSGPAAIVEVIDYDFGRLDRRGIFRDIPQLGPDVVFDVRSASAPDDVQVSEIRPDFWRVRIGDPDQTITGLHRYRVAYELDTVGNTDGAAWNSVGTSWRVEIERAEMHLLADRELIDARCVSGAIGSADRCELETVAPGHVMAVVTGIRPGTGVSIFAEFGAELASIPEVTEPSGTPESRGTNPLLPGAIASLVALLGMAFVEPIVRGFGREQVWAGGAADAAFGPTTLESAEAPAVRRIDLKELDELATTEFAPPKDVSATIGGIVYAEELKQMHKTAWLMESALRGEIEITAEPGAQMTRLDRAAPPGVERVLSTMFAGRTSVPLGRYDKNFAAGFMELRTELDRWRGASGLWDSRGTSRRTIFVLLAIPLFLGGMAAAVIAAARAADGRSGWPVLLVIGAVLAGAAVAVFTRNWELLSRTPRGSGLWLQVESFRRFIADSEARHAKQAAEMGLLREYTAWAVALDELDHWEKSVEAASTEIQQSSRGSFARDLAFAASASKIHSSVSRAAVAPSSSGGGGGGGGSVGGGGGGGGGGSW